MSQNLHWIKMKVMRVALRFLPIPEPEVHSGPGAVGEMGQTLKKHGLKKVLVVTDEMLVSLGHIKLCTDSLQVAGIGFVVYDKVLPNPTTEMVMAGYRIYKDEQCDGIIAFGGGSPMDCAKAIGCQVCDPKPVAGHTGGPGKIKNQAKYPTLIAVPTTAGTGSETTYVAVITEEKDHKKIFIGDPVVVPKVAVLDPKVLVGLPKPVTAATGMDALTHAVESYISSVATEQSKIMSLRSVERIFRSLKTCYDDGNDLAAREDMLLGSFDAGCALSKALLGYVHAVAHQFGGLYGTPHGVANAMVLPLVLDHYLKVDKSSATVDKYVELAFAAGVASRYKDYSADEKVAIAYSFVAAVRALHDYLQLPKCVEQMKSEDVHMVADRAIVEAMDTAPVPCYMSVAECDAIVASLLPQGAAIPPPRSKL